MCCVGIQQYSEDENPCPQVVVSAEEKKESDGVKRKRAARGRRSGLTSGGRGRQASLRKWCLHRELKEKRVL